MGGGGRIIKIALNLCMGLTYNQAPDNLYYSTCGIFVHAIKILNLYCFSSVQFCFNISNAFNPMDPFLGYLILLWNF